MVRVIGSDIVADNIDAACSMPARKLAAAAVDAMAAASKTRLKVMPPDVSATTEPGPPGPFWALAACTASAGRAVVGIDNIAGGMPAAAFAPIAGKKLAWTSGPTGLKESSENSSGSVTNLDFIAKPLILKWFQAL